MPRNKKYWKRRLGSFAKSLPEYPYHLDLRPFSDLEDEGLAYILESVKGIGMLDLNETEITNGSIKLLTGMEYIKELRMKDCRNIDNGCAADLNRIKGLELLHLRNTAVTIDALLQLNALTGLRELLFSATEADNIDEKLLLLKAVLPYCSFSVNGD